MAMVSDEYDEVALRGHVADIRAALVRRYPHTVASFDAIPEERWVNEIGPWLRRNVHGPEWNLIRIAGMARHI